MGGFVPTGENLDERKVFIECIDKYVKEVIMPKTENMVEDKQEVRIQHPTQIDAGLYLYQPEIYNQPNIQDDRKIRPNSDLLMRKLRGDTFYKGNQPEARPPPLPSTISAALQPKTNQSRYNPLQDKDLLAISSQNQVFKRSNSRSKLDSLIDNLTNEGQQSQHHAAGLQYRRPPKGMPDPLIHPEKVGVYVTQHYQSKAYTSMAQSAGRQQIFENRVDYLNQASSAEYLAEQDRIRQGWL